MVKKRCSECRYFFAVPVAEVEATSRCPDCAGAALAGAEARPIVPALFTKMSSLGCAQNAGAGAGLSRVA